MRHRDNESGQALIFVALSMAVLMGFMALAVDVGLLFRARRNMQIAADAAAAAAALNYLYYGSITTAQNAAISAAAANGVTITVHNINSPPSSGPYTATTAGAYFEVLPNRPVGTDFMGVISNTNSVTVGARAVAGTPTASNACVWIGNPTAQDTLHLQGSANLQASGCGIYVNSSSSKAVKITGNPTVNAAYFNINGGYTGHVTSPTAQTVNAPAQSNPLGTITGPTGLTAALGCTNTNNATTISGNYTAPGGVVCFPNAVTLSNGAALGAGLYVFFNGVTIPTGATVTVTGGTLDLYGVGSSAGTLNQASNSILNISAPTSPGTYNGIAIMQPASNTTQLQVQFGSNNQTLDGMIYAPGAEVFMQDNGGGVTATGVVADTMFIKSSSLTIPSYSAAHPTTTPLRAVTLVE
jgi:Flp pilus assembly protein TadG